MKKFAIAAASLCLLVSAVSPTYAADPCEMVMCMWGKVTGNSGGDDCKGPEKAFFDKVKKEEREVFTIRNSRCQKRDVNGLQRSRSLVNSRNHQQIWPFFMSF
ncbi:hypothetical protein QE443_004698 [Pantoea ananatis]|uniref:kikA from plasmid origin n=1 Tax=Pantoea ananas TaxID=553 RepID=UPI002787653D|nr:hypothetical protein [Pantoea ananatis]